MAPQVSILVFGAVTAVLVFSEIGCSVQGKRGLSALFQVMAQAAIVTLVNALATAGKVPGDPIAATILALTCWKALSYLTVKIILRMVAIDTVVRLESIAARAFPKTSQEEAVEVEVTAEAAPKVETALPVMLEAHQTATPETPSPGVPLGRAKPTPEYFFK